MCEGWWKFDLVQVKCAVTVMHHQILGGWGGRSAAIFAPATL
jgi:hypothetical protein